jgi:hypothetical protein
MSYTQPLTNRYRGEFLTEAALIAGVSSPQIGDVASVDAGVGNTVQHYKWDNSDSIWVKTDSSVGDNYVAIGTPSGAVEADTSLLSLPDSFRVSKTMEHEGGLIQGGYMRTIIQDYIAANGTTMLITNKDITRYQFSKGTTSVISQFNLQFDLATSDWRDGRVIKLVFGDSDSNGLPMITKCRITATAGKQSPLILNLIGMDRATATDYLTICSGDILTLELIANPTKWIVTSRETKCVPVEKVTVESINMYPTAFKMYHLPTITGASHASIHIDNIPNLRGVSPVKIYNFNTNPTWKWKFNLTGTGAIPIDVYGNPVTELANQAVYELSNVEGQYIIERTS